MKTICLIEILNGGHREAFMQLFAKSLIENGNNVICVMPNTNELKNWVESNHPSFAKKIHYFDIKYPIDNTTKFSRWNMVKRFISIWRNYKIVLHKIEKQLDTKIDFVFWNCLDAFICNYLPGTIIDFLFPYKWSGLYFHPTIFRLNPKYLKNKTTFRDLDSVLLAKNCVALTIHDEGILEGLQYRINKKTILFPEIADSTPSNSKHPLAKKIKEKANGRIIIGIIGLEPYKGTLSLIRITAIADPSKFFFAFTGVYKNEFILNLPENEQKENTDFMQNLPINCIWETGSLQEGEEYNSVFCSFDIVYIMYKNFYSSSNRLTKAAIFHKLVLGNNYGCVGDDIPRYNLGETADENNIEEQYQKLEILRNRILANDFPYEQWKIYAEKHSTDRLKEKFAKLLNLVS
jgi:hypothetical protein